MQHMQFSLCLRMCVKNECNQSTKEIAESPQPNKPVAKSIQNPIQKQPWSTTILILHFLPDHPNTRPKIHCKRSNNQHNQENIAKLIQNPIQNQPWSTAILILHFLPDHPSTRPNTHCNIPKIKIISEHSHKRIQNPIQNRPIPRTMCIANVAIRATRRSCTHRHTTATTHTHWMCNRANERTNYADTAWLNDRQQPTATNQQRPTNDKQPTAYTIHTNYKCKQTHRLQLVNTGTDHTLQIQIEVTNCE